MAYTSIPTIFENICTIFAADKAQNDKAIFQFDLSGENGGKYWVSVDHGTCSSGTGDSPTPADMTLITTGTDWLNVVNGELNSMTAFMQGKIKVQGAMALALKLQQWFPMQG